MLLAVIAYRIMKKKSVGVSADVSFVRSFFRYCFPKAIYNHPSAVLDYKYFIVNKILFAFIFAPLFLGSPGIAEWIAKTFGTSVDTANNASDLTVIIYTVVAVVVFDFSIFFTHYLQHRIPVLWQFHKVHHSAEVLTPITVYRMHPVDELLTGIAATIALGLTGGAFIIATESLVSPLQLFQVNGLLFIYYVAGYNLRHSHIWLNYPSWLLKVLISPAQHQIHHSNASRHFDKNFGFIFSFWDQLARTIYIPAMREDLKFGLSKDENREFGSILALYFHPFKKAAKLFRRENQ